MCKLKIFTILVLMLGCTISIQAQEPTKEETIKWIKETIETYYAHSGIKNLKVTSCQISYSNVAANNIIVAPIDTNLIVEYDEIENVVSVNYKEKELKLIIDKEGKKRFHDNFIDLKSTDKTIGERMVKAVKHLSKFCKEESPF